MQRPDIKEELDEKLELWCKSVISYCKKTQKKSTAIQQVIKEVDLESKLIVCILSVGFQILGSVLHVLTG